MNDLSEDTARKAYQRAKAHTRESLIFRTKRPETESTTTFVTTFSAHQNIFRELMEHNWHILSEDPVISKYVASKPEITYRRSRSIRDSLVHSHFTPAAPLIGNVAIATNAHGSGRALAAPYRGEDITNQKHMLIALLLGSSTLQCAYVAHSILERRNARLRNGFRITSTILMRVYYIPQ